MHALPQSFHLQCLALFLLSLFCIELSPQAHGQAPATSKKFRVLLLGDSISIGYTPLVKALLKDDAVVLRPMTADGKPENCEGTTKALEALDRWLKIDGGRFDVIHFNFGLHDMKRVDPKSGEASNNAEHPRQAEPATYEKQLRQIVTKLEATGAALVFATTTPVPPGGVRPHRDVQDPQRYNDMARRIMREHGIAVNDLYGAIQPRLKELQQPVNVHFTQEGSKFLAGLVARQIQAAQKRFYRAIQE